MKRIPLTQGKFATVDNENYEELSKHKWFARKKENTFYAVRNMSRKLNNGKQTMIFMHRVILDTPDRMETDHKNHIGLDNRKDNLRICTSSQNQQNRKPYKNGTSKYRGVSWCKNNKKWTTHITLNCRNYNLGYFDTEIKAAKIYDQKAKELFGEFAYLNFKEN